MTEAAAALGVTNHRVRQLIKAGVLPAEQVVPRALSKPSRRLYFDPGSIRGGPKGSPVSRCRRQHPSNVYRHLMKDCIMPPASPAAQRLFRRVVGQADAAVIEGPKATPEGAATG
jgi:hypothetical protein